MATLCLIKVWRRSMAMTTRQTTSLIEFVIMLWSLSVTLLGGATHSSCILPPLPLTDQPLQPRSMNTPLMGSRLRVQHPTMTPDKISTGSFHRVSPSGLVRIHLVIKRNIPGFKLWGAFNFCGCSYYDIGVRSSINSLFGLIWLILSMVLWNNVGTPSINATIEGIIDTLYEMRLETLLSVDDLVAAVMKTLEVCNSNIIYGPLVGWVFINFVGEKCTGQYFHLLQQWSWYECNVHVFQTPVIINCLSCRLSSRAVQATGDAPSAISCHILCCFT